MPGATSRKPREKVLLLGWRAELTVCHAINIAMTVVLPAPVANFRARRSNSGLACSLAPLMWSQNRCPFLPSLGATSVSQMAVSTASTWQKKGRTPFHSLTGRRQCWSKRAVSGVTSQSLGLDKARQDSTCCRISLMIGVGLYSCSAVDRPSPLSNTKPA